jgi:hypothetical protein
MSLDLGARQRDWNVMPTGIYRWTIGTANRVVPKTGL